jgi:hypothetical protein
MNIKLINFTYKIIIILKFYIRALKNLNKYAI